MTGTITKISPYKKSRNSNSYLMVEFKMAKDGSWARTFLCPDYRNWKNWKKLIRVGNILTGLQMKSADMIDADSRPAIAEPCGLNKTELSELFLRTYNW